MVDPALVAAVGVLLAILMRTLWAWYNAKKAAGKPIRFEAKYVATAAIAMLAAIATAQEVIAKLAIVEGTGTFVALWIGFVAGGGWNWFLNEIADKGS